VVIIGFLKIGFWVFLYFGPSFSIYFWLILPFFWAYFALLAEKYAIFGLISHI
jgi:hypothetical protein